MALVVSQTRNITNRKRFVLGTGRSRQATSSANKHKPSIRVLPVLFLVVSKFLIPCFFVKSICMPYAAGYVGGPFGLEERKTPYIVLFYNSLSIFFKKAA